MFTDPVLRHWPCVPARRLLEYNLSPNLVIGKGNRLLGGFHGQ